MADILPNPFAAPPPLPLPTGEWVDAFDGRYYRVSHVGLLPPFLMNVVSASDLWLFLASNGALTAGRIDAEHALFPYQAVDRLYDSAGTTGPFTAIWVGEGEAAVRWLPFAPAPAADPAGARHLYKSVEGDRVWFEEVNATLGLAFRHGWATADAHGFVRQCEIRNLTDAPVHLRLWDGLRNLQPAGIPRRVQDNSSVLADAYKTAELLPGTRLGVFALAAGIIDRPEPLEALRASVVWCEGLPGAAVVLSDRQLPAFLAGRMPDGETHARGLRTSYALAAELTLPPQGAERWLLVADTDVTQAGVAARRRALAAEAPAARVQGDIAAATRQLRAFVASADGLQGGGDEKISAHHFANVLFNVMRGGVFVAGHDVPKADFVAHVRRHNTAVAARHAGWLAALPAALSRAELVARAAQVADLDLLRLATEYLPLTFSRRHGDPSRPWNRFRIRVRDEHGGRVLAHEGNWRDIFQNWEALCLSHPGFFEAVIAKFLNASTADGYNPYRLSHAGIDWEVPEPEDPWASIGYWGDHQVVYLQRLLEWSVRHEPDRLRSALRPARHTYARVPYRIAPFAGLRRDPHNTITFDAALHREIMARAAQDGADARLLPGPDGGPLHVNLVEKLLVLVLTRLTNFVPGGGIWMNTQRPEWNDANNALVGYGLSVVTLGYVRRMLAFLGRELWPALGAEPVPVAAPVADLLRRVHAILAEHRAVLLHPTCDDGTRGALVEALGEAGCAYRARVYDTPDALARTEPVAPAALAALGELALAFVDHTLRANRRSDGLYHTYNQLEFTTAPAGVRVHHLHLMVEGQVAVLSAGLLSPAEAVQLLTALRRSALYRADQHSYLLYPDRPATAFMDRNLIRDDAVAGCPLLAEMVAHGDARLVVRDAEGTHRFAAELTNAGALEQRLATLATEPRWAAAVTADAPHVRALYEEVFRHRTFTGRSGTMFGYEGLGCIYWHMVAKLLVAVQENWTAAEQVGAPEAAALAAHYSDVRAGLGFNKSPATYGAVPSDPYSHTPGHSGAQQPGMTGQVKEEIITRFGELGVCVEGGRLSFRPRLLQSDEFTAQPDAFRTAQPDGSERVWPLPAGALGFTCCGTPVIYRRTSGAAAIRLHSAGSAPRVVPGDTLDREASAAVFARNGAFTHLEVELGADFRPGGAR